MKKLMITSITLMAFILGGINTAFTNPEPVPGGEQCVAFKNVKARLVSDGNGMAHVDIKSDNDGATMVTWIVDSWENGRPIRIAGGNDKVYCCDIYKTSSFSLKGKSLDECELKIGNCHSSTMY